MKALYSLLGVPFFAMAFVMQVHSQSWPTNGLLAYYKFDGNVSDATGNGNNGTNNGATFTTNRFGVTNGAISFNNNSVTTSFFPPLGGATRTISGWFNVGSSASLRAIFSYGGSPLGAGTRLEADIQPSGTFIADMSNGRVATSATYNDSKWHNFAIVVPSNSTLTNLVIYMDGVFQAAMTGNPGWINTQGQYPLMFGQFYAGSRPLVGLLDDVRVYNRELSAAEVQQLYQYDLIPPPIPPRVATATGVISYGFFTAALITDGGAGYTNSP